MDKKIIYIYSEKLIRECNRLPNMLNRASMVQDLINCYGLLLTGKFQAVQSLDATEDELKLFHSTSYIDFLKKVNDLDNFDEFEKEQVEYGLSYECPILERNFELVQTLAGGSISAAKLLAKNKCKIAINWFGGWHHAQRDSAEGFCYVNDIVLAIHILSTAFDRILYLDLDIHHGDGVQNAFEFSNKILTLSFHKKSVGFYPGTGDLNEVGSSKGKYYSLNVPLLDGIGHNNYLKLFDKIFPSVLMSFKPKCIVMQCGADGLNGDRIGQCNLTLKTIGECVDKVLKSDLPTLFLGGGGYNFANTARLWTYLTSIIADKELDDDIPDTSQYFVNYGPTYELHIDASLQKDVNTNDYINNIVNEIALYCSFIV
ncbi:histone deacetylase 8-like [Anoplophora glabripennis]|uniref:histone deacetylase 8-like n=1 Tax=Anoplophora glabripennis TaxID=217634 RepID=UPI000873CAC8|nr:histone deacetylase 8-like [Anoplophora glabripennis]